jgi:hypothetical protein
MVSIFLLLLTCGHFAAAQPVVSHAAFVKTAPVFGPMYQPASAKWAAAIGAFLKSPASDEPWVNIYVKPKFKDIDFSKPQAQAALAPVVQVLEQDSGLSPEL